VKYYIFRIEEKIAINYLYESRLNQQIIYQNFKTFLFQYTAAFLSNGDETTAKALMHTIFATKTICRPLPGFESFSVDIQDRLTAGVDCDEVYPNIYIGDA
jgi:hypothetical protein